MRREWLGFGDRSPANPLGGAWAYSFLEGDT